MRGRAFSRENRVYFFLPPALPEGAIVKIGFTYDIGARFQTHASTFGGEPIASIPGNRTEEASWHQRFDHLRVPVYGIREVYWLTAKLDWAISQAVAYTAPYSRDELAMWHAGQKAVASLTYRRKAPPRRAAMGIARCGCGMLLAPPVLQLKLHRCDSQLPEAWRASSMAR